MIALAVGALLLAVMGGQYLWLRPAARAHIRRALYLPLRRRARTARRSLAALVRAALLRPYRGHHTPRRTQP
ncbi:hypothetical protein E1286_24140 [Nonomuraea terrae]|uniref:Uncharacterized protein n=1 Tax=Nonomuraea terrae TaxID=2530383 RepID=A0A4R4YKF4_9ACTN|nr:hypothetical protein [Nonomuraea terrae]TDD45411.1 hypothetical protein E1286_24140 [Nonomuraea terrae]